MARKNIFGNTQAPTLDQLYQEPFNRVPVNTLDQGLKPYGFTVPGVRKQKPSDEQIRQMAIQAVINKYRKAHSGK